jgi:hypothetical protein
MDDFCVPILCPASQLHEMTCLVVLAARDAAREYGLQINFAKSKTEAILSISGAGAFAVRRTHGALRKDAADPNVLLLPVEDDLDLRMVPAYRHLGITESATPLPGPAVATNTARARGATAALLRPLFMRQDIPVKTRCNVASAVTSSRALYAAGSWNALNGPALRQLAATVMKPFLCIASVALGRTKESPMLSYEEAAWATFQPAVSDKLVAERLRYAARVLRSGPLVLCGLLQSAAGDIWRQELLSALDRLRAVIPDKFQHMPPPREDPSRWEQLMVHPSWCSLVRRFLSHAVEHRPAFEDAATTPEVDEHMCFTCGHIAKTKGGFLTHAYHRHGHRNPMAIRCPTTTCPSCALECHGFMRLYNHLAQTRTCATHVESLPLLLADQQKAVDGAASSEQKRARAEGRHWSLGPPAVRTAAYAVPSPLC